MNPRQAKTWPGLSRSTGIEASAITLSPCPEHPSLHACRFREKLAGRRRAEGPPTTPVPTVPNASEACEAQPNRAGALFERGGRRVLAAPCSDHGPRLPMMRSDEMQDEIAPDFGQVLKSGVRLHMGQGAELVPIPIQDRLADRSARLGEDLVGAAIVLFSRRPESALPARRSLSLVMQGRRQRQRVQRRRRKGQSSQRFAGTSARPKLWCSASSCGLEIDRASSLWARSMKCSTMSHSTGSPSSSRRRTNSASKRQPSFLRARWPHAETGYFAPVFRHVSSRKIVVAFVV